MRPLFFAVLLTSCYVETIERAPAPQYRPPITARPTVRVAGRLDVGASVETALPADIALGYAAVLTAGARVVLGASSPVSLLVYGPQDQRGLDAAPVIARGEGTSLELTAPRAGTYVFAALGSMGTPITLSLSCASGECRAECGGDGTGCPEGATCALVLCIRAPCPSYCQPLVETPPPELPRDGSDGSICGTRGVPACAAGLDCIYPDDAACGETDRPGTCQPRSPICTREYRPVCGCDGRTYGNRCGAYAVGVSVRRQGECGAPG